MKKTKYISIAYLLFITSAILVTFIDGKAHNEVKELKNNIAQSTLTDLKDFKVLVIGENSKLSIIKDTINQFDEFYFVKDTVNKQKSVFEKKIDYRKSGDTLFIDKTYANRIKLKVKNLEQIIAKEKGNIYISNYISNSLIIDCNDSKVNGINNNIKHLEITATNHSNVNFSKSKLDTIRLISSRSKIQNGMNKTIFLEAKLKDSSNLRTSKTEYLNIESDSISKYLIIENFLISTLNRNSGSYHTISETIELKCTKDNIEENYQKISSIINAVDREKINREIIKKLPKFYNEDLNLVSLNISKNRGFTSSSVSYNLRVVISIKSKYQNSEEKFKILKQYKELIKKELILKNIDLK